MKYADTRPYADPEKAARKPRLVDPGAEGEGKYWRAIAKFW